MSAAAAAVAPLAQRSSPWTWAGLLLAMFGTPLFLWLFRLDVGEADGIGVYLLREGVVFAMAAALLLIVARGERLPWSSLAWHTDRLGKAALWGLLGVVLSAVVLVVCVLIAQGMGWKLGLQTEPKWNPPIWVMAITVLRAGVTEELFYRGFALERLRGMFGTAAAVVLTVIPFALFHYRQGPAGILIAGMAALVLSFVFLKSRSLPAVMLAHFTVDFIPNVLLPLVGVEP